jgi:hypothetical protein
MTATNFHSRGLATSTALSEYYKPSLIIPLDVMAVLEEAGVKFMLVGVHALSGWTGRPRATRDVDVLVATGGHKKAVAALLAACPHLTPEDHEAVTRLKETESGEVAIDVLKANQPLFREAFKHTHPVSSGALTYSIPSLEFALAMKLGPMISLTRAEEKKYIDAHDFIAMVKSNPAIDLDVLHDLGQLAYNAGDDELVRMVGQVRAGEKLQL